MSTSDTKRFNSSGTHDLPEDLTQEILLRLPVKSLVRFKSVCRQWYNIIESQRFVEQHFGQRSNKERLLVGHCNLNKDRYAYALFVDDTCSGFEEPAHLQMPNTISQLLGPVNGVFCLVGHSRNLALLNPAMRQLKSLPKLPGVIVEPHLRCHRGVFGFGLDPLGGDYKVVSLRYFWDIRVQAINYHPIVFVYNLGSDSWKKIKDVGSFKLSYTAYNSFNNTQLNFNTYLNGVYYWTMKCIIANTAAILAFNMTTEKFQEIQVPNCLKGKDGHLTIHGDSIALLSYRLPRASLCEVWVMEKEGSWNRVAVVGPFEAMFSPLCLWKNNELLIRTSTSFLMLCNICTKQLTQVRLPKNVAHLSWVFSYKENLVSIKGKGNNCLLWDASPGVLYRAWTNKD